MTRRPIGYYVHHHGAGHRARAEAIAAASDWQITLLGTGVGSGGIDLADDRLPSGRFDGRDDSTGSPAALHFAPIDHDGVRSRVACLTGWIAQARPALIVVDVSAEVAMLSRLASVPTVYVRLNGERGDPPHVEAFRSAVALLAPFHRDLDLPSTPDWVKDKTHYQSGITAAPATGLPDAGQVLVVVGRGGVAGDGAALADAARACPDVTWRVIGPVVEPADRPANLHLCGWVDDPERQIAEAGIVIGAAGDGLVGAVLAAGRPFICIPQPRPFDEQNATAGRLDALGAAIVLRSWPAPTAWPKLFKQALALPSQATCRLHDADGAHKAAAWLHALAASATGTVRCRA